jgi:hypothetical protein
MFFKPCPSYSVIVTGLEGAAVLTAVGLAADAGDADEEPGAPHPLTTATAATTAPAATDARVNRATCCRADIDPPAPLKRSVLAGSTPH